MATHRMPFHTIHHNCGPCIIRLTSKQNSIRCWYSTQTSNAKERSLIPVQGSGNEATQTSIDLHRMTVQQSGCQTQIQLALAQCIDGGHKHTRSGRIALVVRAPSDCS